MTKFANRSTSIIPLFSNILVTSRWVLAGQGRRAAETRGSHSGRCLLLVLRLSPRWSHLSSNSHHFSERNKKFSNWLSSLLKCILPLLPGLHTFSVFTVANNLDLLAVEIRSPDEKNILLCFFILTQKPNHLWWLTLQILYENFHVYFSGAVNNVWFL